MSAVKTCSHIVTDTFPKVIVWLLSLKLRCSVGSSVFGDKMTEQQLLKLTCRSPTNRMRSIANLFSTYTQLKALQRLHSS